MNQFNYVQYEFPCSFTSLNTFWGGVRHLTKIQPLKKTEGER